MMKTSPASPPSTETYRVYKYFNGIQEVYADPLMVHRHLMRLLDGASERIVNEANSDDVAISTPARDKLVAATRQAFGLLPFDPMTGAGAVEEEVMRIWDDFNCWLDKKKAKQETSPTDSPSTEGPSSMVNPYLPSSKSDSPSTSHGYGAPIPPKLHSA